MAHFETYSRYYDLLYQDKDYASESAYVIALLNRFSSQCLNVLELGCGTGRHGAYLAEAGFCVTGVETSEAMLQQAIDRSKSVGGLGCAGRFNAVRGDARTVRLNASFDAVMSLFHVLSYQIEYDEVNQVFATASLHLERGGIFLFDVWYGPAVLTVQPSVRVKRMESDQVRVIRIAEPSTAVNANRVDVNYTVFVEDKVTGRTDCITEQHRMRYFFVPEIEFFANAHGMKLVYMSEWMSERAPSDKTWGVCFVGRKC